MQKENKNYRIYLNGQLIPVSEEVYKAWYRPIWDVHNFARRHAQCGCPDWHFCEGDCGLCVHQKAGDIHSSDLWKDDYAPECAMTADPADIVIDAILTEELLKQMDAIDPYGRRIAKLIFEGINDRDAAEMLGLAKSTYSDKKLRLCRVLKELRKKYFEFF